MKKVIILLMFGCPFFGNAQNVGIGTSSPASLLTLDGSSPDIGILKNGLAHGTLRSNGVDLELTTSPDNPTGRLVFGTRFNQHMSIDNLGRLAIGPYTTLDAHLKLNGASPIFALQHNDVQKGFIRLTGDHMKFGTYPGNTGNIIFSPKNTDRIWIDEDGKMGLGTATPSSVLTINGTDPQIQLRNGEVDKGFIQLTGSFLRLGTNASNSFGGMIVRTNGNDRMYVNYKGQMGLNYLPDDTRTTFTIAEDDNGNSGIELVQNNSRRGMFTYNGFNTFLTSHSGDLYIYRNSSFPLICHSDGSFSMGGSTTATGYRFSIHGKAIATDFTIQPINNWPDYVFTEQYRLRPIAELKQFIASNGHLPGIPSAREVATRGIDMGEMSRQLTEKVEELSLYIIQLREEIDQLKNNLLTAGKKD